MKKVLVTGATGGLGRNAVEHLLRRGIDVKASGRKLAIGAQLQQLGAEFHPLDLGTADLKTMAPVLDGVDCVWHCAALSAPWGRAADFEAANVRATEILLQAAARSGVKHFIHVSTPALYFDFRHHLDIPESYRPRRYVNHYAASKARAEESVQKAVIEHVGMRQIILRPRAIFGPHDQALLPRLEQLLTRQDGRLPLPRGGRTLLDLTYVGNVVQAMELTSQTPGLLSGSVYNITNGDPQPLGEVLSDLFRALARPCRIRSVPPWILSTAATLMEAASSVTGREPRLTRYSVGALSYDMTLDISKARRELGYQPAIPMAEALRLTADWRLSHG